MAPTLVELSETVIPFIWPLFRISGLVMTMPIIGSRLVPGRVKIIFAASLVIFFHQQAEYHPVVNLIGIEGALFVAKEILIGALMGFILSLVFQMFVFGGQIVAMQTGLGFSSLIDPQNGSQVPVLGQLYLMVITLLFLVTNGHLIIIGLLIESYSSYPMNQLFIDSIALKEVVFFASMLFVGGISLALPAIIALLVVNFTFGTMTRSSPQLNIFSIGFPFTMIVGLFIVFLTLPILSYQFNKVITQGFTVINQIIR